MPPDDRHSEALEAELISDPELRAQQEAKNGLRQFDRAIDQIEYWLHPERRFKLRPSALLSLNRVALEGVHRSAGVYRGVPITITGSKHTPPAEHLVPELVEDLCEYVNSNWDRTPIHLASFVMWRLNWIHPFADGNGRTTRVASFVVLCVRLGYRVPGSLTIPEQIANNKTPYYEALERADEICRNEKKIDVSAMEELLGALLAKQLASVLHDARTDRSPSAISSDRSPDATP